MFVCSRHVSISVYALTILIGFISGLFSWIQTLKLDPTHLLSEVNRQTFAVNMEAEIISRAPGFLRVNH